MLNRWAGPFEVVDSPGPNTYTLRLPRRMRISPVINVDRLKRYRDRTEQVGPKVDVVGEAEVEIVGVWGVGGRWEWWKVGDIGQWVGGRIIG